MKSSKITIEKILYTEVLTGIENYQSLVLAFSGGIDSTVLLDILYDIYINETTFLNNHIKKKFTLRAIHINHGLSQNSDYWSNHCSKECEKRNIPFNTIQADYNKKNLKNIESIARKIRYQHLFKNLQPQEILLTAQHLDDQAETFLLALKRGSGPKGLSSMPKKKLLYNNQLLLRPLIKCNKKQIKKYAQSKKLTWIIDDNNTNTRFDRNFLRLQILPELKKRWPNIDKNIARSAQLCANQEKLLNELLENELKQLHDHNHSLSIKPLIDMSTEKRQALLRRWLVDFNIQMPSYKKLYHIWKDVILSKKDAMPIMQLNKQFLLRRFQNRLYVIPTITQRSLHNIIIHWTDLKKKILLPNALGILISIKFSNIKPNKNKSYSKIIIPSQNTFSYLPPLIKNLDTTNKILNLSLVRAPFAKETITIKFNYTSPDKISIVGKLHRKKIKKIWQELKIPPWIRKNIPLLFYNEKLISALGVFITEDGKIKENDTELKIYWIQKIIHPFPLNFPHNIYKNNE